jgi:hypothetical protein
VILARIIYESVSRDREDGLATGQPQGVESEAYLNSTSQVSSPEDAREDDHIRGRSSRFMNYPGYAVVHRSVAQRCVQVNITILSIADCGYEI